ncbi:MAG TPA: hypothetical protein VMR74_04700 [Gammaproteobacteria bacterium]|nr:hypothetical protein [Gammaproteobacteria bacterium]
MARLIATACLLGVAVSGTARAQDDEARTEALTEAQAQALTEETEARDETSEPDLTVPPRVESSPADARLEPAPEEREDMLEAVVAGGQTDFRLPDLGTSFREEEEPDPNDRIDVTFLYLYDPDNVDPAEAVFPTIEDLRRVGFLRVIELRFGRRSRD